MLFHTYVADALLDRHQPKLLVLDLTPQDLLEIPQHYDRLYALLPYAKDNGIPAGLKKSDKYIQLKLTASRILPFNSMIFSIVKNCMETDQTMNGYLPHTQVLDQQRLDVLNKNLKQERSSLEGLEIDELKVELLNNLLQKANENSVEVIIVMSPILQEYSDHAVFELFEEMAEEYNATFNNYLQDPRFRALDLYYDAYHLNENGAEQFTDVFLKDILSLVE